MVLLLFSAANLPAELGHGQDCPSPKCVTSQGAVGLPLPLRLHAPDLWPGWGGSESGC